MALYVNNGGTWSQANNVYINNGGWAEAKEVWFKNGDSWSRSHLRVIDLSISTNVQEYDIKASAIAYGWDQSSPVTVNVTVGGGVVVYASNTSTSSGMTTNSGWPAACALNVYNYGYILGQGGAGGKGAASNQSNPPSNQPPAFPGLPGGTAFTAATPVTIYNYGIIAGGGGGGGGGGGNRNTSPDRASGGGGGGGGRTGLVGSLGGDGGTATNGSNNYRGGDGGDGTFYAAGVGGTSNFGGRGGAGGEWGVAGVTGTPSEVIGRPGGATGKYVDGISFVTMVNSGQLLGTTA